MKNIHIPLIIAAILLTATTANSQLAAAKDLAGNIAEKMKDSLRLNPEQKNRIYEMNMNIHDQKMDVRKKYAHADSIRRYTQRIENTRDSLYRQVLTKEQYLLYKEKKRFLVAAHKQ